MIQQPDTKVTVGAIAAAVLGTALWLARVIRGEPLPMTPDEAVYANMVLVLIIQYATRNRQR